MPKESTITKEVIVNAAFEVVRIDGFTALSARNVARKIGCSTQPIYWMYENMEVLKQDVISKMLTFLNSQISSYVKTEKPFLDLGLGYVRTAFLEPILFKSIYVENILGIKLTDIIPNEMMTKAMKEDVCTSDIPENKLEKIAVKAWIFVHGLASLIATGMLVYDEKMVENLLNPFFTESKQE